MAREFIGSGVRRAKSGMAMNGTRGGARGWSMTLAPIPEATYATLVANTINNKFVTCTGDFLSGVPTTCWVVITNAAYYKPNALVGMHRIVSLEIREVAPAMSLAAIVPVDFLLTSVDSPDSADPDTYIASIAPVVGDAATSFLCLVGAGGTDLDDGVGGFPTAYSAIPERSWLTHELDDGLLVGRPSFRFTGTQMYPGAYTGTTIWRLMSSKVRLYHWRLGVTTFLGETNYGGVSLGGGELNLTLNNTLAVPILLADRLLLEVHSRLALQNAAADNGQRQQIAHGAVPGPLRPAIMTAYGTLVAA
jgi:hypothetical protein